MMKSLIPAILLTALSCPAALAADAGSLPQYCEGAQMLGDGSWYAKSDISVGGMTYPATTMFTKGETMNGMDVAAMLTKTCRP